MSGDSHALNACTIVARNYLAFARVLARSFIQHHPDSKFTVLVIDDVNHEVTSEGEPFEVMHLDDIDAPRVEVHRMATVYNVMEFATAMKPWLLQELLKRDPRPVSYLDPDIEVFAPFGEVAPLAREHGIVLVPHVLQPMPRDGLMPSESQILISGVFNLGFVTVGHGAGSFLEWWAERLKRDAVVDPCRGLFTDQRWVDFVPALFPHHVITDPGFNVAYWNVFQRPLERIDGRHVAAGLPLRFYHFSGFDPAKPYLLSKHQMDRPRTLLSDNPQLAALCEGYATKLWASGHDAAQALPYGLGVLQNGLPLEMRMRRLYREALLAGGDQGDFRVPDPFEAGGADAFVTWLHEPALGESHRSMVPQYLLAHWRERADLQAAFPDLAGKDAEAFLTWARTDANFRRQLPPLLLQTIAGPPAEAPVLASPEGSPRRLLPGACIAGYFHAELGVGQAGRLLVSALEETGIPFSTFTYGRTASIQQHAFRQHEGAAMFGVNILCVNADQTSMFVNDAGPDLMEGRYNVGLWFWEVERFPHDMHAAFSHVDEIWVASEFTQRAISPVTEKPVHVVPLPTPVPTGPTSLLRADVGLPEGFVFLFCFDVFSIVERKNPIGLIEAFKRAFPVSSGCSLVIKTINGATRIDVLEQMRLAAGGRVDIQIFDGCLPTTQMRALTELADCTVSLHRSEGYGLTLAEAMALGKPVIATGYSGNLTFMNHDNSYLVPFTLVPVGPSCHPYPASARWAEPDIEAAAAIMRNVFADPEGAAARGKQAKDDIRELHNSSMTASFISNRLFEIWGKRLPFTSISGRGPRLALTP